MAIIKRFIAGAVCPRCAQTDKLRMFRDEEDYQVRECVSCGYSDRLNALGHIEEIPTRVNQPRAGEKPLPHEDEVTVVRLLDPAPGNNGNN